MKKRLKLVLALLVLAGVGCLVWSFWPQQTPVLPTRAKEFRFKPLDIVTAHIVRMEKSDAKSIYLADDVAEMYRTYFERAGLTCASGASTGRFKLVFAAGANPDWEALQEKLLPDGVLACAVDVRGMSAAAFQKLLLKFPCAATRLWMPGEQDWLLTGRAHAHDLKLEVLLDALSPEGSLEDLAEAHCDSLPQLYANYVATREELLPAFQGDLSAPIRAEALIPCDVPTFDWLVQGEVDADIYTAVKQELRSLQVVRRVIAEGNLLALQGDIEKAIGKWSAAHLRNPNDIMLLDRLYRLAVNAQAFENVGNLKGAAACYETMIAVRPTDAPTILRYAECMKRLGYREVANGAFKRAGELMK